MSDWIYSDREWEEVKNRIGQIESSNRYDITGGSGNAYHGRYQMGKQVIKDSAYALGLPTPDLEVFKKSPHMQDKFMKKHYQIGNNWLNQNSKVYKNMSNEDKKKVLPMLQFGAGNVRNFLDKGIMFKDGNGTPITKFRDAFNGYEWDEIDSYITLDPIVVTPSDGQ
jgi:hypothetical protein